MIGTEKYYTRKRENILAREMRRDAMNDLNNEASYKRAPGHMTMRAVTALEHKRDENNNTRFAAAIFFLMLSVLIEVPYWLDLAAAVLAASTSLYWIGMSFYTWKQTKARVRRVLENHEILQDLASMERY